tara:strand:- start:405 stop:551 length:147 start_codon:yes stop_codon:yes gene_type:complete
MSKEQLIELCEYYRKRHNEICQDDYVIEKPYYGMHEDLIEISEFRKNK